MKHTEFILSALQDEIDDQCDDQQNGNLHSGAFHQRAWTTIWVTPPALTVISISSVHAGLLIFIRQFN
jgi:hypothetical protein